MLIFYWLVPFLAKIDAATFEVNMTNQSQDIMKKQFQQQLKIPSHKQILSCNMYTNE